MASKIRFNKTGFVSFIVCMMLMAVVPIYRDNKIFGLQLKKGDEQKVETLTTGPNGEIIINTTELCQDVIGYAGPTPVEIYIKAGKIEKIQALPNRETPEFFGAIRNSDMLESLDGKTLSDALNSKIDGVSGATFSSNALLTNIRTGVEYALKDNKMHAAAPSADNRLGLKFYITLLIILSGAIVPLFIRNKNYRILQLVLNVLILGFWGGTFISYSIMISYLTNGVTTVVLIPAALMLITAFIYPMFGKTDYYCLWLCPYGSFQELMGKWVKVRIKISPKTQKALTWTRDALWFVLMWLLWTGLWFDWMGYEPFAAFFFTDASAVVLGIAGAFLILSIFVNRPYCRFVCPTGSLFKLSEGKWPETSGK